MSSYRCDVHMIFRTIFHFLISRRSSALGMHDVGRVTMRVVPTDLDTLGHMNNGIYLSLMDIGRVDLLVRAGALRKLSALGFYPVIASETITFRKSLQPWQKFTLESAIVGYDDKAVYIEQRFVAGGEIYATGWIRGRFLRKTGGTVSVAELAAALGVDVSQRTLPTWLERWAADVALPSTREQAVSDWE